MQFQNIKFKRVFSLSESLKKTIKTKNPIILDIGGNVGQSVRLYKKLMPNCTIHSVEPDPESFRLNQIKSKKFKKVKHYNFFLSNVNGMRNFYVNKENNRTGSSLINFNKSSISKKFNFHPKEKLFKNDIIKKIVEVKKSNDFFSKFKRIDFCKIDTGGSELKILENISKKNLNKIKTIQVELLLDDVYKYNSQKNFSKIIQILLRNNFKIHDIVNIYKNLKFQRTLWIDIIFVKKY